MGIDSETAVADFLRDYRTTRERLEFESVPNQSTLWRTWNERFGRKLRETVSRCGLIVLVEADQAGISTPRDVPEPDLHFSDDDRQDDESSPSDREILSSGES